MRKKTLLSQLHKEVEKNALLEIKLKEAEGQVEELNQKIDLIAKKEEEHNVAVAELEMKIAALTLALENKAAEAPEPHEQETEENKQEAASEEEVAKEEIREPAPVVTEDGTIDVTALEKIPVNREIKYASEAIGDIVVSCASVCNEFAKKGGAAARELINLALGRTEVFKADCLTIATSDTSYSVKKECIDRIKFDTEEYFKSLSQQKFD